MPITTEITVKPQAFAAAVAWAAKWVSTRPNVPVQGGISLACEGNGKLAIAAYSESVTARACIDAVHAAPYAVNSPVDQAIVSGRLLAQLAPTFGSGKPVVISGGEDGGSVIVRAGSFRATLPTLDEGDWPTLPDVAPPVGKVAGAELAIAAARVCLAHHDNPTTSLSLSCVHLDLGADSFRLIAASHPQAVGQAVRWQAAPSTAGRTANPSGAVLADAAAAFNGPDDVTVGLSDSLLSFSSPSRSLVVTLIDLTRTPYPVEQVNGYLAYEQPEHITFNPDDLLTPVKQAAIMRGKEGPVRIRITEGRLAVLAAEGTLKQESDGFLEVDYQGDEHQFGINPDYFSAALHSAPDGPVTLGFGGPEQAPLTLASAKDPDWHHILMPVRINH